MKPSDFQTINLKQIRMALPVKTKGAEFAIADMLAFCQEHNNDRFHFVSLKRLINHFYQASSDQGRDKIPTKVKIEGLYMLLEQRLVVKSTRHYMRFSKELKNALAAQCFPKVAPQKNQSSKESKFMTATTLG